MKNFRSIAGFLAIAALLTSCFKEDEKVPPHDPGNVKTVVIEMTNNYKYQVYFDLSSEAVVGTNEKKTWDLGFECGANGWHILLNTSNFMLAAKTGITDFSLSLDTAGLKFKYDESTGNLDSTAIGNWLSIDPIDSIILYTHEVYVIDRGYDELGNLRGLRKIVFESWEASRYTFRYANLDGSGEQTFTVTKDPSVGFVNFSFDGGGQQLILEPPVYDWDLIFTQYTTLLFTDEGDPYPYLVTGALSNPMTIAVHQDTLMDFTAIDLEFAEGLAYNSIRDEIGYDWKDVVGDLGSGNVSYVIVPGKNYLIRDWQGFYYKLRFVEFYSMTSGEKGYPTFEMQRL
jgi:hypothetical protein